MAISDRIKRVINAFRTEEATKSVYVDYGPVSSYRQDKAWSRFPNERSIISSIYTRIGIDVAALDIRHVKLDDEGRYSEDMDSFLNECFTVEANLDQAPRAFKQDVILTLFDEGVAAIVPVDHLYSKDTEEMIDIRTLRVGRITQWYPKHIKASVYNIDKGERSEITLSKRTTAIVENPLYAVMNEPNSTLQRLIRKLNLLDSVDEALGSGKLDLIIQLPYVIKSEARRQQAEQRRNDIEFQLKGSQYGIAYTDGTEKITQLNRPAENNLLKQIEYLTNMLYGQLGLTEEVMNGTADDAAMINYFNRTIEPLITALVEAMQRTFIIRRVVNKQEQIKYFQNPFRLVPVKDLAEIADKFTRNEIMTANEIRGVIGLKPSKDPKADELKNSNMPQQTPTSEEPPTETGTTPLERNSQNGS